MSSALEVSFGGAREAWRADLTYPTARLLAPVLAAAWLGVDYAAPPLPTRRSFNRIISALP